ncbi:uncharacterized protein [Antedon mediterranea]|uniref:uncharacterized protein n=1 Tax=Antedon mediterranea TaxID=105859 RepID=UPI003AF593CD
MDILEEAFELRKKRETEIAPKKHVKFQKPLKLFTWKCLGDCLISLYEYVEHAESFSFSSGLDLASCLNKKDDLPFSQQDMDIEVKESAVKENEEKEAVHQTSSDDPTTDMAISSISNMSSLTSTMPTSISDTQRVSQTITMETDHDYASPSINIEKSKKGPKRKRGPGDEPAPGKRRSARVRNTTTKKKEEVVNYQTRLRGFLPSSLRNVDDIDESSQDSCIMNDDKVITAEPLVPSSTDTQDRIHWKSVEEPDVRKLLEVCVDNNNGVVDVMTRYLVSLSKSWSIKWPSSLASTYVHCYDKLRKHLQLPSIFCNDATNECLFNFGNMVLVYVELKLDESIEKFSKSSSSVMKQYVKQQPLLDMESDLTAGFYHQDILFTEQISTLPHIFSEGYLQYAIRVYWVKARFLVLCGNIESAIEQFDLCSELLSPQNNDENSSFQPVQVMLSNCKYDDIISLEEIDKKKKSLEHTQSLEEVRRLFDDGEYSQVSSILLPTLKQPMMVTKHVGEQKSSERPSQILLLLQSLLKQEVYQQCLSCAEVALIEAIHEINHAVDLTFKEEWIDGLIHICIAIDTAIVSEKYVIKKLETGQLIRLTNNLIRIIEIAMERDIGELGQVSTVYPWILLYRLIKLEEDQIESMKIVDATTSTSIQPCLPSSLMLLLTAHECLGRRSWCCNDKGALLKLQISVLEEELFNRPEEDAHPFKCDLEHALEQSFYCLYSHPNRKTKARHLSDHGVDELPLLWEDSRFLFNYFKPKILPEFDSYKTSTMSSELESLLLKISRIIPAQENPANTLESIQLYLDGTTDTAPYIPQDKPVQTHVVQELYYLLADYYFKNKEWGKAIKFYLHDLCVNPDRFDSWAGMAMARSTRLDLKINSCDSKSEGPIFKQASSAARCFERAFQIDSSNSTLWMEYGSLSYMMHSYSSRQLKQQQTAISSEQKEFLTKKKNEMLQQAKICYLKASECEGELEEEEWLVHYMLGKIAEKEKSQPQVYLDHYKLASMALHENEARYPKKIPYHNPPDLALESLEVFFRIHTSILKLLEFPDKNTVIDYKLLKRYVSEARQFPFARGLEKRAEGKDCSTSDTDTETRPLNQKIYHHGSLSSSGGSNTVQQLMDHDYIETRKKVSRTFSQESTDTASDLDFFSSGDEPMSPKLTDSSLFQASTNSLKPPIIPLAFPGSSKNKQMKVLLFKEGIEEKQTERRPVQQHGDGDNYDTTRMTDEPIEMVLEEQPPQTTVDEAKQHPFNADIDESGKATKLRDGKSVDITRSETIKTDFEAIFIEAIEVDNREGLHPEKSIPIDEPKETVETAKNFPAALSDKSTHEFSPKPSSKFTVDLCVSGNEKTSTEEKSTDPTIFSEDKQVTIISDSCIGGSTDIQKLAKNTEPPKSSSSALPKGHSVSGPISSFQMAFMMSSVLSSNKPSEKNQPESEEARNKEADIDIEGKNDLLGIEINPAEQITAKPHQLSIVRPSGGVSEVLRNLQKEYRSSGESQSEEEVSIAKTKDIRKEDPNMENNTDGKENPKDEIKSGSDQQTKQYKDIDVAENIEECTSKTIIKEMIAPNENDDSRMETDAIELKEAELPERSEKHDNEIDKAISYKYQPENKIVIDTDTKTSPDKVKQSSDIIDKDKRPTVSRNADSKPVDSNDDSKQDVESNSDSKPVESDTEKAVDSNADSKPVESDTEKAVDSNADSKPVDSNADSKPVDSNADSKPVDSNADSKPEDSNADSKPEDRNTDSKSVDSNADSKPEDSNADSKSEDRNTDSKPVDSNADSKPEDSNADSKSEDRNTDSKPVDSNADSKPEDSNADSKSEDRNTDSKSVDSNANSKPKDSNADSKPEDRNTDSKSVDSNADSKPEDSNADSKSVESNADSKSVESNADSKPEYRSADSKPEYRSADSKPEYRSADSKPVDSNANSKPEDRNANSKPVDSNAESKPEDGNADSKPVDSNADSKPEDGNADSKPVDSNDDRKECVETHNSDQRNSKEHVQLIDDCILGLKLCLSRFSQHYKALFRMAHVYHFVPTHKNNQWSRDILLGTSIPWTQIPHLAAPALFADANKNKNFFHGIWRIPVEEIDRSGSFPSHMHRAIHLLVDVLLKLKDHQMLLQLSVKLNRTPELNKKYLRDQDRQFLSTQSYEKCLDVLKAMIEMYKTGSKDDQGRVLMFVYRANQVRHNKLQISSTKTNHLLIEAFKNLKEIKDGVDGVILEEALRHCANIESIKHSSVTDSTSVLSLKTVKDSGKTDTPHAFKSGDHLPSVSNVRKYIDAGSVVKCTINTIDIGKTASNTANDDSSKSRGATSFADQFKNFASSFKANKFQQEASNTKPIKRLLKPFMQLEEPAEKLMRPSQEQTLKQTPTCLSDTLNRFPALYGSASKVLSSSSLLTKTDSTNITHSKSPPKNTLASGLTIPLHRIAVGDMTTFRSSDQVKITSQGTSGIHARILPIMSDEEKQKLRDSLSKME